MTDNIAQWIAFGIAICMVILVMALFGHYQNIHSTHTLVTGKTVSVESRTTRINVDSTRKTFHPIVTIPTETGKQVLTLKKGGVQRVYDKHRDIALIYPNGRIEDIRLLRATDRIWPTALAATIGIISFYAGLLFRREAKRVAIDM